MKPFDYKFHSAKKYILQKLALIFFICISLSFSMLNAQSYEILFDIHNASGWFGGDNRVANGPRHVGVSQSVLIDSSITLNSFAFDFTSRFDYAENPDGFGHEVTLTLNIRNDSGVILQTEQVVVSASYEGGWITWSNINMNVAANTTLIFSAYLVGAYDTNQYTTGNKADANAGYLEGERYVKQGISDPDMELWPGWTLHPWDSNFWLQGTLGVIPVELTSFTATTKENVVTLIWQTATEKNNSGFEIFRFTQKDNDWSQIDFIEGNGTTTEVSNYSFVDENLLAGSYSYKLVQIDFDGTRTESDVVNVEIGNQPSAYLLMQNYPNPFNPSTTINFTVTQTTQVTLKIFDVLGNEVNILVNQVVPSGNHDVQFDASGLPSGLYFYTLNTGNFVETKKMVLMK
jgi:hypothetical protein